VSIHINTRTHDLARALQCKLGNRTLSPKSLKKLTLIANRQFGGSAERVFGGSDRRGFNGDAVALRSVIASQLASVRSPAMKQIMEQWLARLPVPLAQVPRSTPIATPPDKTSYISAWLASSSTCGSMQAHDVPAAGIPEPDYEEVPEIPPVDYEVPQASGEPHIPPPDYHRVSFSDDVEVIQLTPEESREPR